MPGMVCAGTSNAAGSPPREQRKCATVRGVGALPVYTACMLPVTACISMFVGQPSKFPWKFLETENGRACKFPKEFLEFLGKPNVPGMVCAGTYVANKATRQIE